MTSLEGTEPPYLRIFLFPHQPAASPPTFAEIHASTARSSQSFLCGDTATGSGKSPVLRNRQSVDRETCILFWTSLMPMDDLALWEQWASSNLLSSARIGVLHVSGDGTTSFRAQKTRKAGRDPYCISNADQRSNEDFRQTYRRPP